MDCNLLYLLLVFDIAEVDEIRWEVDLAGVIYTSCHYSCHQVKCINLSTF